MASLAELRSIVGEDHARDAGPDDAVDGVSPRFAAEPASVEEISALMKLASRSGWRVAPRGGGTKLAWGSAPTRVDLVIATARMDRLIEHAAGDLVTSMEAGITLEALQGRLADASQMLALDPPERGATIGGVIAANASGPRRYRYGTVRDLLIGITVVLADGTVAKSGGKVVKNVAGYDLGKLFTGSLGTLGVIAGATFRLHPRPARSAAIELTLESADDAGTAVSRVLGSTLVPAAVEIDWPLGAHRRLLVLFEGIEPGVEAQLEAAALLLGSLGSTAVREGDDLTATWASLADRPWAADSLGLKVSHLPAELPRVLLALSGAATRREGSAHVRGSAGAGVVYASIDGVGGAAGEVVTELRAAIGEGSVVVQHAPAAAKQAVDVWGPVGALDLMRRVKREFDPEGVLNPGRFVGGI